MKRAIDMKFETIEGRLCCVIVGEDAPGGPRDEIAIPAEAFRTLNAALRRRQSSEDIKQAGGVSTPALHYVQLQSADTWDVGSMPTETGAVVGLLADRGTESEIGFRLTADYARQLGERLIAEAHIASLTKPQSKN